MQTLTDVCEFSRREVNSLLLDLGALLLIVSSLLLAVGALAERLELARHLLHGSSEVSQLTSDERRVLTGGHSLSGGVYAPGGQRNSVRTERCRRQRDAVRRNCRPPEKLGNWPPEGLEYHVAFRSNGEFRLSEICDSREQFDASVERLMPVLKDVGIELAAEPEMLEIHNIVKR